MPAKLFRVQGRASLLKLFSIALALLVIWPAPAALAARKFSTVVIDAGHGGFDRGGIPRQRVSEKVMTLDVALRLQNRLRQAGYRVVMTRDSDVFVTLGDRVRVASRYRDAIFVSIHFNSATRVGANGIETYYYSNNSAKLAADIHRHVISGTSSDNRGIRRRGYFVLRRASVPAVLVECGFLTNPEESRQVLESTYRQRLADRVADGIMGKPTPPNRPVVAGLTHLPSPIRSSGNYNDFVRAEAERRVTSSSKKSTQKSKKSSRSSSKKKSSSSKKSSSTKKKSSSTPSKKKKKPAASDE